MDNLDFAIKMEVDGEIFYSEQAEKHMDTNLHKIFLSLAKDERKHADILRRKKDKLTFNLVDTDILDQYKNVFAGADDFHSEIKSDLSQLDVYILASEKEKKSIELYKKMLSQATDEEQKKLFQFLIKEEEAHFELLDDMASHVIKPQEWVEDAEFGRREDY